MAKLRKRCLSFIIAFVMMFANFPAMPYVGVVAEDGYDETETLRMGLEPVEGVYVDGLEPGDMKPVLYGRKNSSGRSLTDWSSYGNSYIRGFLDSDRQDVWDSLKTMGDDLLNGGSTNCLKSQGLYYYPYSLSSSLSKDEIAIVWEAFLYSNPQYFFFDSTSYVYDINDSDSNNVITYFSPCVYEAFANGSNRMTAKGVFESYLNEYEEGINSAVETCNNTRSIVHYYCVKCNTERSEQGVCPACGWDGCWCETETIQGCDYEKEHVIHDFICNLLNYDTEAAYNQSVYSAVVPDESDGHPHTVCAGYSKLSTMLLNHYGIESIGVVHDGAPGGHAWNVVCINGTWYCYDATWDDQGSYIIYTNLNRSKSAFESINGSHVATTYDEYLPTCSTDSQFVKGTSTNVTTANCGTFGSIEYDCHYCDNDYIVALPKNGQHDFHYEVVMPTCTTAGYTHDVCSICGSEQNRSETPALGHDWSDWYDLPDRIHQQRDCSRCGIQEQKDSHTHTAGPEVITVEPTCGSTGTGVTYCTICGSVVSEREIPATGEHSWNSGVQVTAPTCKTQGQTKYTCTVCGAIKTETDIPTIAHVYVADTNYGENHDGIVAQPTCTTNGSRRVICSSCHGSGHSESIPALGHDWGEWAITRPATINRVGEEKRTCNRCGQEQTRDIPKINHDTHTSDEGIITTEPTCTAKGVKTYKCTGCGVVLRTEDVPALGHNWSNWTVTTAPTVTSTGVETRTCSRCNTTETRTIAKLDCPHQEDEGTVTTQPTCAKTGVKTYKCSICGEVLRTETIPKTNEHHWNSGLTTKGPTCTLPGEKTFTCTLCHTTKTEQISPLGHSPSTDAAIAATCTQGGKTEGSHCSRCHIVLVRQADTEPLGHNWTNWNVVTEATATADGQEERHCTRCNASETRVIPATGQSVHHHTEDNGTITKAATCSETGVKTYECTECGEVIRTETIDKIAHTEVEDPAITPTCNSFGRTAGSHCSVCGATIIPTSVIPKTDHNWNDGVVTVEPTKDSTGTKLFTCLHCGATKTEIIPKIADTSTDDPSDNPSNQPGDSPSDTPSDNPSDTPSDTPSDQPSDNPSDSPSQKPDGPINIGGKTLVFSNLPAIKDINSDNIQDIDIYVDGNKLEYGKDYIATVKAEPEKGIITITVDGIGEYEGHFEKVINVAAGSINRAHVDSLPDAIYTGEEIKPVPVLKMNGELLVEGQDYTVAYYYNVNAGVANVVIQGIDKYYGTMYRQFIINPKQAIVGITLSENTFKYNGEVQVPEVTVLRDGAEISEGEYKLSLPEESIEAGIYTVRVDLTGNYKGVKVVNYNISPKDLQIQTVTSGDKSCTVEWNAEDNIYTGCQIQYSTKADFSENCKTVATFKASPYTIKKLSSKKTYYVRIRPCKLVGVRYTTGEWSKAKEVTIE